MPDWFPLTFKQGACYESHGKMLSPAVGALVRLPPAGPAPQGITGVTWQRFIEKNPQAPSGAITLTPTQIHKFPGEQQTLEALVLRYGLPVAGVTVDFTVSGGPNEGQAGSAVTDWAGTAVFTLGGVRTEGTDTIAAAAVVDGSPVTATAQIEWNFIYRYWPGN